MTAVIPPLPPDGAVVADLETLRLYVGARTGADDVLLQQRLDAAIADIYRRVKVDHRGHPEVQEACLLSASRLYKRRQSPEGVVGFGGEGAVVRLTLDPDIERLISRHLDLADDGMA